MADRIDITIEFKEESKLRLLRNIGFLNQHAIGIHLLLQDVFPYPLVHKSQLQRTGIAVVAVCHIIRNVVSVEVRSFTLCA